jgi:hypothetical protein
MFDILPEECLFIIIQHLLDDKTHFKDAHAVGNQNLQKGWKKQATHQHPLVPFNAKDYRYKMIGWERAPFTKIIPLMKIMPDVFDTNTVWTYILEQETRNGKRYKRKPKNSKIIFKQKVQETIKKRYVPLICKEEELSRHLKKEYIKSHKNINLIQKAIHSARIQIPDISKLDELKEDDPLPPIIPTYFKLPAGYVGCWNWELQHETSYDMRQLSTELSNHERIGKKSKKYYDITKKNIYAFKKIIDTVMEQENYLETLENQ